MSAPPKRKQNAAFRTANRKLAVAKVAQKGNPCNEP